MDTRNKNEHGFKDAVELHCDSRKCYRCKADVCEERLEDLLYGVGP
jgi:hypothetical protein